MSGKTEQQWLFVQMGDEGQAYLTWCADRASILWAVTKAVFSNPLDKLDDDEAQQVEGITESLIEDGFFDFEGDPGLKLFRVEGNGFAPAAQAVHPGEREALELDAKRYRWLRDEAIRAELSPSPWAVHGTCYEDSCPIEGIELDAAIDAALGKQGAA